MTREDAGLITPETNIDNTEAQCYHSYLLRIWRGDGERTWRASLQEVGSPQRRGFSDLEALAAFLRESEKGSRATLDEV